MCGFIKCKILPPTKMFFPVLPIRLHEKLMFVLCFECAKLKNHDEICNHLEKKGFYLAHGVCTKFIKLWNMVTKFTRLTN